MLFCLCVAAAARAGEALPRKVLAFYDPAAVEDLHQTPVHQNLEIALNHLGLEVVHRSVAEPLPGDGEMDGVRGVITWFNKDTLWRDPDAFCDWISRRMRGGIKWALLERFGFFGPEGKLSEACVRALGELGLDYGGEQTRDPLFLEIVEKNAAMVEFERPVDFVGEPRYALVRRTEPAGVTHLKVRRTDIEDSAADLVFTTARGGYAHEGYVIAQNADLHKKKWTLNPFAFFEEAFGLKGLPRPDVTTVNGARLFMSHIDGDGIFNVSLVDKTSYSGEVILQEILRAHPELPFSVSVITGYFAMPEYRTPRAEALYRDLFSASNVEAAAHGHAHPLVWRKGTYALEVPGYSYDPRFEIEGAARLLRGKLSELKIAKPANLYFWTGDCLPAAAHIAWADAAGLVAVNGGDSRFDARHDSVAFLRPIGLLRQGRRQIYAAAPNENVFTNLWRGPYYGYREIAQSFANTESPRRLKPIDVYYHFYSGERAASLSALRQAYAAALQGEIFPVFVSEYVAMARSFFDARIEAVPGGYRVGNAGALKTVRFDDAGDAGVDTLRSRGVLGFAREKGSLYVFLDESPEHEIRLGRPAAEIPYFARATFFVSGFEGDARRLRFFKRGWRDSKALLGGLRPRASYKIREGDRVFSARASATGELPLEFGAAENGGPAVAVEVTLESL